MTTLFRGGLQEESSWNRGSLGTSSRSSRKRARLGILGISDFLGILNFSGISDFLVLAVPRAYPAGPSTDSHTVDPVLPGPSPHLNQDLSLAGPQPVGPLRLSVGLRLLVTKGDTQKADDATVPDHLWLRAFALGYGSESCLARHRSALGMPLASLGGLKEPAP